MTDVAALRAKLEELRAEVNALSAGQSASREHLNTLITDIERRLEAQADEGHHARVLDGLRAAVSRYEVEHPRATGILNDILVALGNLGI